MKGQHQQEQIGWGDFVREETVRLRRVLAGARLQPDQVEDIIQEVWLEVIRHWGRFQGEDALDQLRRWMARVARSKKTDLLRRLRRQPTQSLHDLATEPMARPEASDGGEKGGREQELFRGWLEELRGTDSVNYRLVYGRYVEGLTVEALASEWGVNRHVVSCRLYRQIKNFVAWAELLTDEGTATL